MEIVILLAPHNRENQQCSSEDDSAVSIDTIDIGFDKDQLEIAADIDVTISFTNTGFREHDIVIEGTDYATAIHTNGESEDLVVNLPAGESIYFCSVPGHREQGMQGTLIVS